MPYLIQILIFCIIICLNSPIAYSQFIDGYEIKIKERKSKNVLIIKYKNKSDNRYLKTSPLYFTYGRLYLFLNPKRRIYYECLHDQFDFLYNYSGDRVDKYYVISSLRAEYKIIKPNRSLKYKFHYNNKSQNFDCVFVDRVFDETLKVGVKLIVDLNLSKEGDIKYEFVEIKYFEE